MNSSCQILPGVKNIYWVECSKLPSRIDLQSVGDIPVSLLADLNDITFFGSVDCRCVTEKENNGWKQKSTLKFRTADELPFYNHIAFVVTDVNGISYIIGSKEHPFPVVKSEYNTGVPSGDPAGLTYEISHEALRSMVKCII
ncbi:MAG: hypothetical protein J1E16_05615 [Muribaculaceae bacterium]|nr:hypothetical protein [Muribaculaceae bacterium]